MSDQAMIEYHEVQDVDVGVVVLFGIFMLLLFNIMFVCIFYRKWKIRRNKFRFEYLRYGRSEYLRRQKAQPIGISFKYVPDWFQRNWYNRFGIQSMRKDFSKGQHRANAHKRMQPKWSNTKSFRNEKATNSLHNEQPKRHPTKTKIIVNDGLLSKRIDLFKVGVSKDTIVEGKARLNAESLQNRKPKGHPGINKNSTIDTKQIRTFTGRTPYQCPLKDSEVEIHTEREATGMCNKRSINSVNQSMNSCSGSTSDSKIETLSTLFLIHSDDVLKVLSRMESQKTKPNE